MVRMPLEVFHDAGGYGVLRLRDTIRGADRAAALRMTAFGFYSVRWIPSLTLVFAPVKGIRNRLRQLIYSPFIFPATTDNHRARMRPRRSSRRAK